jgi:hypothetical protein
MEKAFTPGSPAPWRYEGDLLLDSEGKTIARLYGWSAEQRDINGNNIAKYPDLYTDNLKLREALRQAGFALESIRGAEAWIDDAAIKALWQRKVYPALETIKQLKP